jgi:signal peptidase II
VTGRYLLLVLIGVVVALDFATKAWALTLPASGLSILPFLDLWLGFNIGISFGLLAAEGVYGYVVLIVLTLGIASFFLRLAWISRRSLERAGYGAIVGGAFGNLLDRLPDGAVTDFLDVHAGGWHFPTFNLADVAISVGVGLLLLAAFGRRSGQP